VPRLYGKDETDGTMMLFSRRSRRERQAAERLYNEVVAAARARALYRDLGVPDTLQGRFEMMALHLFALVHRLMHEPGDDPELARRLSETFVTDMDAAFRDMGVSDTRVPKRMQAMFGSFAGRIAAYEAGLKEGPAALEAAIARNIFPDVPADGRAAGLARHLQAAVDALQLARLEDLRDGRAAFPPLGPAEKEMR
jgi:cytochrome b pre-mRNA-processing protein 3